MARWLDGSTVWALLLGAQERGWTESAGGGRNSNRCGLRPQGKQRQGKVRTRKERTRKEQEGKEKEFPASTRRRWSMVLAMLVGVRVRERFRVAGIRWRFQFHFDCRFPFLLVYLCPCVIFPILPCVFSFPPLHVYLSLPLDVPLGFGIGTTPIFKWAPLGNLTRETPVFAGNRFVPHTPGQQLRSE